MLYTVVNAIALVGIILHLVFDRQPRSAHRTTEIILTYLLSISVGLMGIIAFTGHAFKAAQIAEYIGWPAGNPFQFEIAVANLGMGVLGIMCAWKRGSFWLATLIMYTIFGWGAAVGHVRQIIVAHNYAPGNAGAPLYTDIAMPTVLIVLYVIFSKTTKVERGRL